MIIGSIALSFLLALNVYAGHDRIHTHARSRRQAELSGSSILFTPSPSVADSTPSPTTSETSTSITLPTPPSSPPNSPPKPVPSPMDLSVSYSLSNDCLLFISTFLTSSLFQSCLPLSLLLTTSTSFQDLVKDGPENNYATLNTLIAYTNSPKPGSKACQDYFAGLETSFTEKKHCAADLKERNPSAIEVRNGLGNYEVMRGAGELVDPDEGEFCYLQAVADGRPDDMYLWSLPAGISVPRTSKPTCSKCSSLLLNHYSTSLSSNSVLNATIIHSAADTINAACGNSFVSFNTAAANSAPCPIPLLYDRTTSLFLLGIITALPFMSLLLV